MKNSEVQSIRLALTCALALLVLNNFAQVTLHLIPTPKSIKVTNGTFAFTGNTTIGISDKGYKETVFSAKNLSEEIKECYKLNIHHEIIRKKTSIILGIIERDPDIDRYLSDKGINLPESAKEEGYILDITPEKIGICAASESGLFYGVQTLKQLIRSSSRGTSIPCMIITDWPGLRYRGWMDDISRGPIPSMDFLKSCIRRMSEYKQNFFTLYTEHTFQVNAYPDLAPPGSLTALEVKELTEYAAQYHIDIIGNFQSFGHMAKILNNPFYTRLSENADILNPADEETYTFLKNIYDEIVPAYKSPFFNINCDETFGLGEGKSKAMADKIGLDGIYAYHINRIDKLMQPYGKRLMMWGDIAVGNPRIIDQLPKNLIILSWGYDARESFEDAIIPFKKTGFDFMVAPGVSCWNEIWPFMGKAAKNISNYVRDGAKFSTMGMMNTAWDDNGHNLFNYNWHGLIWGAECSWTPCIEKSGAKSIEEYENKLINFNRNLDNLLFGTKGITSLMFTMDSLRTSPVRDLVREGQFWSGLLDLNPENTDEKGINPNTEVLIASGILTNRIKNIKLRTTRNSVLLDHLLFAIKRVAFIANKNRMRILLYNMKSGGSNEDVNKVKNELNLLINELYEIKKEYIRLWKMENREYWLEKNLNDYNNLARSIIEAENTVFIEPQLTKENNSIVVDLSTIFNDKKIVFTTDGSTLGTSSPEYTKPVIITHETVLKACIINDNSAGPISEKKILVHKAIGRLQKLHSKYSEYNPAYAAGGDNGLTDGLTGSASFADGRWQGFQGQDIDIELDFGAKTEINRFSMKFFQQTYSWIVLPKDLEILVSDNGKNYMSIRTITHDVPVDNRNAIIHNFEAEFSNISARYMRVKAHTIGNLPAWHPSAGQGAFLFSDEIIVR